MKEEKQVTYAIEVSVSTGHLDKMMKSSYGGKHESIAAMLSSAATVLIRDLASGGMMLDPDSVARIDKVAGQHSNGPELARAVENAFAQDAGRMVVKWYIDPTYYGSLEENARIRGCTVQEMVQDGMNWVMEQGWLWDLDSNLESIRFTKEGMRELKTLLDRTNISSADILEALRQTPVEVAG